MTEREICEYCIPKSINNNIGSNHSVDVDIFQYDDGWSLCIDVLREGTSHFPIHFCPMCGRKLEVKND